MPYPNLDPRVEQSMTRKIVRDYEFTYKWRSTVFLDFDVVDYDVYRMVTIPIGTQMQAWADNLETNVMQMDIWDD
jgi:hypothetical protein